MTLQQDPDLPERPTATPVWRPHGWVALVVLLTPLLYALAWPGNVLDIELSQPVFLSLHTVLEMVAVVVGMLVALTARYVLDERERRLHAVVAMGFLMVAGMDMLHMLSYTGMPDFLTPNSPQKSIVLGLLGRVMATVALIVWCVPWPPALAHSRAVGRLTSAGLVLCALLGVVAVLNPQAFHSTFDPEAGHTPMKLAVQGTILASLALALAGQLRRMAALGAEGRADEEPLRDALLLMTLGELFLLLYGKEVATSANLLGHLYKVLAYACLYRGVFLRRVRRPYLRLQQARQEVEQHSAEYRELLQLAPVGVVVTDTRGNILLVNRALEEMFDYGHGELIGRSVETLLPPALRGRHQAQRTRWADGGLPVERKRSGLQGRRKDGSLLDVEVAIEKTRFAEGWRMTACVTDVSHRRTYEAQIEHRAAHDLLTGLPNRWRFLDELERVVSASRPTGAAVALALLNLSGFKQVNARHGGAVADALLRKVAQALAGASAPVSFVARLEGDVFGVIARGVETGEPLAALQRQLAGLLAPGVSVDTVEWPVAAAMGLAAFPVDAADAEGLLRCAEVALDESKRQGRAQATRYDPVLGRRTQQEQRVHARLQAALREGTLALHYQPQVEVASGRVHGFEALVRWTDAELGVVSPAVFIPIAENSGLIGALGEAVLGMACRQLRQWREQGLHTRVSVNLSPREFRHPGLVARIAQELARHGLPADTLAVEVTESAVIDDFDAVAEQLQALVKLGVAVHLDDFGTGHSSLAWLRAFPIMTIKIDRSFVRDMVHDASDEAIVRAVIGLGHTLGCQIVAEGVEREDQLQRLRALRCEAYQGWLFSPALPAAEATALLQRECEEAQAAE